MACIPSFIESRAALFHSFYKMGYLNVCLEIQLRVFYNEIQSHMWLEIFFKIITIFSRA